MFWIDKNICIGGQMPEQPDDLNPSGNPADENPAGEELDLSATREGLPPELLPAWEEVNKNMQRGFHKKTTEVAELRKKIEAELEETRAELEAYREKVDTSPAPTSQTQPPELTAFEQAIDERLNKKLEVYKQEQETKQQSQMAGWAKAQIKTFKKTHPEVGPHGDTMSRLIMESSSLQEMFMEDPQTALETVLDVAMRLRDKPAYEKRILEKAEKGKSEKEKLRTLSPGGLGITPTPGRKLSAEESAELALKEIGVA